MAEGRHNAWFLGTLTNVLIMSPSSEQSDSHRHRSSGNRHSPSPRRESPSSSSENMNEQAVVFRSSEVQLIDRIDSSQLEGQLSYSANDPLPGTSCPYVELSLSRHGLKVLTADNHKQVIDRLPLHSIAQSMSYDDGLGHWNVVFKVSQTAKNIYACYVFQTKSENEATDICRRLNEIFQQVLS